MLRLAMKTNDTLKKYSSGTILCDTTVLLPQAKTNSHDLATRIEHCHEANGR